MRENKVVLPDNKCTGCMACADVCPLGAISFKTDKEGFMYPSIDRKKCVWCGKCVKICPSQRTNTESDNSYFGFAADDITRAVSTSGGFFTVLAKHVIENGGLVIGAVLDDDMQVRHCVASSLIELERLRRTKYVQSDTRGIFKLLGELLQTNKEILFSGTPCQCEAVRNLYGKKENLIVCDIICYGVPSPGFWNDYKTRLENVKKGKMTSFFFRDKKDFNDGHTVSYVINGHHYSVPLMKDLFSKAYFNDLIIRPSCHTCSYTTHDRSSDFTIGDFWGVEKTHPEFNDGQGCSLVICHNERAKELFNRISSDYRFFECGSNDMVQPRLDTPTKPNPSRKRFFFFYHYLPFRFITGMLGGTYKLDRLLGRKLK